jgi:hypothetical protein
MDVVKYDKSQWDLVAEGIHQTIFKEVRPSSLNRFDYALVIWDENRPIGYITCRETDSESIYISYGGQGGSAQTFNNFTIQAWDSKDVRRFMEKHGRELAGGLKGYNRNFGR